MWVKQRRTAIHSETPYRSHTLSIIFAVEKKALRFHSKFEPPNQCYTINSLRSKYIYIVNYCVELKVIFIIEKNAEKKNVSRASCLVVVVVTVSGVFQAPFYTQVDSGCVTRWHSYLNVFFVYKSFHAVIQSAHTYRTTLTGINVFIRINARA